MSSHRPATPPRLARALAGAGCALALLLGIMAVASQSEPLAASRLAELRERVFLPREPRGVWDAIVQRFVSPADPSDSGEAGDS